MYSDFEYGFRSGHSAQLHTATMAPARVSRLWLVALVAALLMVAAHVPCAAAAGKTRHKKGKKTKKKKQAQRVTARRGEAWNAARYGQVDRLQGLLEEDPDMLNAQEPQSLQTLVMAATLAGQPQVVKHLLDVGADTSVGEMQGYTPFHGAGFQGRAEVARVLLQAGLDPQDTHEDGFQAIHRACWGGEPRHTAVVRVLVEEGGVPFDTPDGDGRTPLDHARRKGNAGTIALLEGYARNGVPRKPSSPAAGADGEAGASEEL